MFKKLLTIALAVIATGALVFILKDRIVFGKMAFIKSAAHGEEDENEKTGIMGAMSFWSMRAANPATGVVDTNAVYTAYAQANAQAANKYGVGSNLIWQEMGPDNVGGRTRAIIVDKDSNNVLYAGGVTGGMFKSYDGGSSWKKIGNNPVQNENVVSLCQGADGAIYYGTGENGFLLANSVKGSGFSAPGYFGQGVFKSTDHGNTFTQLTATGTGANGWTDVSFMAADPTDPNLIYAGNDATLMVTKNGGTSWAPIAGGLPTSGVLCKDIRLTKDGNTMYVTLAYGSSPGGTYQIWRSEDKGNSFTRIGTKTVPASASSMMVAIAPNHESTIYASVANASPNFTFNGVYRSDDKGDTWNPVVVADQTAIFNPFASQGFYDNCIAVDPTNYNKVYYAGLNLFSSELVGGSVQTNQLSDWSNDVYQTFVNPAYIHADQHIIIFDRTAPYPCMYVGTDGGISKSTNVCNPNVTLTTTPATSFFNADYGFNTTQFYGIGVGADNPSNVIAGAQDNGEISVQKTGITELDGASIDGGDAGYTEVSKLNPNFYVEEYVEGSMSRSFDAGNSWSKFFDGNVVPPGTGNSYAFMSWLSMWESANDPTSVDSVVFVDGKVSYKAGQTITVESPNGVSFGHLLTADLPAKTSLKVQDPTQSKFYVAVNGSIWMTKQILNRSVTTCQFFEIANIPGFLPMCIRSTVDGNTIFAAGITNGSTATLYRVTGLSGKIYKYNSKGKFYPDSIGVKTTLVYSAPSELGLGVAIDDNDDNHVLFGTGTYNTTNNHVFVSTNAMDTAGAPTFTNISNNMPSLPVYDVLIDSHNPKMYLAATDLGIYSSLNAGLTWAEEDNGMERVPVSMLRQQKFSSKPWDGPYIYAATFGRGVFYTSTLTTGVDQQGNGGMQADKLKISLYPNPVQTIENISVSLPSVSSVTVTVYNVQGRLMQTYQYDHQPSGQNVYNINTTSLQQGTYFVRVNAGTIEQTDKMLVLH